MEYVGIDWASRRAAWCALDPAGELLGEGVIAADLDGLTRLVARRGLEVSAAVEMMSGAVWVARPAATAHAAGLRTTGASWRALQDHRVESRLCELACRSADAHGTARKPVAVTTTFTGVIEGS